MRYLLPSVAQSCDKPPAVTLSESHQPGWLLHRLPGLHPSLWVELGKCLPAWQATIVSICHSNWAGAKRCVRCRGRGAPDRRLRQRRRCPPSTHLRNGCRHRLAHLQV